MFLVEFSADATAPAVGNALYFATVSCVGGGCRTNISFAEGAAKEDVVRRVASVVLGRLEKLLEGENYI